jgi:hypothetical protein
MQKKNTMKKIMIPALSLLCMLVTGCGAKDDKNEAEKYPTYDTTSRMENLNNQDPDSSMNNKNNGEMNAE